MGLGNLIINQSTELSAIACRCVTFDLYTMLLEDVQERLARQPHDAVAARVITGRQAHTQEDT